MAECEGCHREERIGMDQPGRPESRDALDRVEESLKSARSKVE